MRNETRVMGLALALAVASGCSQQPTGSDLGSEGTAEAKAPQVASTMLPAYETEVEKRTSAKGDTYDDYRAAHPAWYQITEPPSKNFRHMREWEPMQELLTTYSDYTVSDAPIRQTIIDILSATVKTANTKIGVVYQSASAKSNLTSGLKGAGLTDADISSMVNWYQMENDTIWHIDYGPLFLVDDAAGTLAVADFRYYHQRTLDDAVPTKLAQQYLGLTAYRMPVNIEGGTFQGDGLGTCYTGERAIQNTGYPVSKLEQDWGAYAACDKVVVMKDITDDGTGHIDMFFKLAGPTTAIVGEYKDQYVIDATNKQRMNDNVALLQALALPGGKTMTVHRLPFPSKANGVPRTYLNSTLVNKVNLWPVYSNDKAAEAEALAKWKQVLPDYTHVGILSDKIASYSGTVHCITRTIPQGNYSKWIADGACQGGNCSAPAGGYDGACLSEGGGQCWGPKWSNLVEVNTCAGLCGGAGTGGCYCDAACVQYGDCCPDYQTECGGGNPTGCNGVTFEGCCDGTTLSYCENDALQTVACAGNGCGWDGTNNYYNCGFTGADPSGQNPLQCGGGTCTPSCTGKACGSDGCGGSCGTCGAGEACNAGVCQAGGGANSCVGYCDGQAPGGCYCDAACAQYGDCCADYQAVCGGTCTPSCTGKACGDDGCGGSCGTCGAGEACNAGVCQAGGGDNSCVGNCDGQAPGGCYCDAACAQYGDCCADYQAVCGGTCTPSCTGKACGDDGCGGSCGTCGAGEACNAGVCQAGGGDNSCVGNCDGQAPGGCYCDAACAQYGDCCADYQAACGGGGTGCGDVSFEGCCEGTVLKYCENNTVSQGDCAANGCGWDGTNGYYNCGFAGADPSGQNPLECSGGTCTPDCAGKACGDDGCGGSCGTCGAGTTCTGGQCVAGDPCQGVSYEGCCEGTVLKYCEANQLAQGDCGANACGWNAGGGYYDCGFTGADPSGQNPLECSGGTCTPSCAGKTCGDDGCGGSCGSCGAGQTCNAGVCEGGTCTPSCAGKECGSDGCGATCGTCGAGKTCNAGVCEAGTCTPDCAGKACGDDGCGNSCGACAEGESCTAGVCEAGTCTPDCTDKACGDDGCGNSCGDCAEGETCNAGVCEGGTCTPDCTDKACGDDGCGNSCGDCAAGETCNAGVCEGGTCTPDCAGKACGDDGCGGTCGDCATGETCNVGVCEGGTCTPDCAGKACGDDGCGGTCGDCAAGETCNAGVCEAGTCKPDCTDKACGDDGCGGTCGECGAGESCNAGACEAGTGGDQDTTGGTGGTGGTGNGGADTSGSNGGDIGNSGTPGGVVPGGGTSGGGCSTSSTGSTPAGAALALLLALGLATLRRRARA